MTDTADFAAARLPEPERDRWQPLRAGIHNLWEYDDQRFVFHRGRLLLRGRNESGKTKALELLLPFVLDASLAPQRLDPFGSTSRSMHWNLVHDAEGEAGNVIGYVWLELGRRDDRGCEYATLGAGLRANRHDARVSDWYFVTDLRVDRDLDLTPARVPLARGRLEEAITGHGLVFQDRTDYRRHVNEHLFGMAEDQYAALIDTLLQLQEFLEGEMHEHLRARLRQAHELVRRMTTELERRPTAADTRLRLRWIADPDAPPGAAKALQLTLTAASLLCEADRAALRSFLQQRLAAARNEDGAGTLQERLLQVLDYRQWHRFVIEYSDVPGSGACSPARLTAPAPVGRRPCSCTCRSSRRLPPSTPPRAPPPPGSSCSTRRSPESTARCGRSSWDSSPSSTSTS
jgi:hypothetical protein